MPRYYRRRRPSPLREFAKISKSRKWWMPLFAGVIGFFIFSILCPFVFQYFIDARSLDPSLSESQRESQRELLAVVLGRFLRFFYLAGIGCFFARLGSLVTQVF